MVNLKLVLRLRHTKIKLDSKKPLVENKVSAINEGATVLIIGKGFWWMIIISSINVQNQGKPNLINNHKKNRTCCELK